jgi:hypothetical protein
MPRHYSTRQMAKQLCGLLGTPDLNAFETGFVESMQRHLHNETLTEISDRQDEVLDNIFHKHFA